MNYWSLLLSLLISLLFTFASQAASGSWNDFERQQAVLKLLNSTASSFECKRECKHRIFNVRSLDFGDHQRKLIAASSSSPDNNCHACAPQLSYFIYRVDENGWKLTSRHIAYHHFGSWGDYNDDLMSFDRISNEEALVILRFGYTGQGYTEESVNAFMPTGKELRKVLSTCSGSDNEGAIYDPATQPLISWSGDVNIAESFSESGPSKIVFDVTDHVEKTTSKAEFAFDGKEYKFASGDERMKECGF